MSADLRQGTFRWKRSTGTFPRSQCCKRDTGRSGLVRSALEKLSLFSPTFSVRQKHGAESFAVCGRRLRGHVPSKNTSPTALSWISLFGHTDAVCFCPCTMIFVPAPVISQHVRSALEKLPLFVPFSVRQKHGAESFAVCGRRLRGHVPSKNTSASALSWISLFGHTDAVRFCPCTMGFVFCLIKSRGVTGSVTVCSYSGYF